MTQPAYDIPLMRPRLPDAAALLPYLQEIDRNRWYANFGPLETRLEQRLAGMLGLAGGQVTGLVNGTVALALALSEAAGGRRGYCLMPSFTFVATAHAAVSAGLTPWFLDIDPNSWTLSPEIARAALRKVDGPVVAVLPVAAFGAPMDAAAWDEFAEETGLPVVMDAAAGVDGARIGQAPVMISLHATKPLAAGEGAIVAGRDAGRIQGVRARSNFGFQGRRSAELSGTNGKMNEYSAAVGLASLDAWSETRESLLRVARLYRETLSDVPDLAFAPGFDGRHAVSTCNVRLARPVADEAISRLAAQGIEARQWWEKGCHLQPAFNDCPRTPLPETEHLGARVIGLPFYRGMDVSAVERVRAALLPVLRG